MEPRKKLEEAIERYSKIIEEAKKKGEEVRKEKEERGRLGG